MKNTLKFFYFNLIYFLFQFYCYCKSPLAWKYLFLVTTNLIYRKNYKKDIKQKLKETLQKECIACQTESKVEQLSDTRQVGVDKSFYRIRKKK